MKKSKSPFRLPVSVPGWFPEGIDPSGRIVEKLYLQELTGASGRKPAMFPVQFCEPKPGAKGDSRKWILGGKIESPASVARGGTKAGKSSHLSRLVRELAQLVRKYNASLYRLRRLHFHYEHRDCPCPPHNPRGGDRKVLPDPDSHEFCQLAEQAETDWTTVNKSLKCFLKTAGDGYGKNPAGKNIRLVAADMVEVNGYVVSMRVVVEPKKPESAKRLMASSMPSQWSLSSSHTSVSSAFSSS